MKKISVISSLVALSFALFFSIADCVAFEQRDLLKKRMDFYDVRESLVMDRKWVPYPAYADRPAWDKFMGDAKADYIKKGEEYLDYKWKVVTASSFLEFERSGNRYAMQGPYGANSSALSCLLLAELAEGEGRFLDQIINGVYALSQMTTWSYSAHNGALQKSHRAIQPHDNHLIDLGAGGVANLMSWTYYFMKDEFNKVDPEISRRLRHELQVRILDPFLTQTRFHWMARRYKKGGLLNNWVPWVNSNMLISFMLLEDDRDRYAQAVYNTIESVDKFLNYIKGDGACEEGPGYWQHAAGKLLDYVQMLSLATGGKFDFSDDPMFRRMGEFASRSFVGGDGWVVNFADAAPRSAGNPFLAYRYGDFIDSDELKAFGAYFYKKQAPHFGVDIFATLASIAAIPGISAVEPKIIHRDFTWYPETEFCFMGTPEGIYFATKGGHNGESHNHNDVGTCTVWIDESPVLIDAGVGTYSRQTFSDERYTIWTMQSAWHNVPTINGVMQHQGADYKAADTKASKGKFSVEIAGAYPEDAKVKSWIRSYDLKGKELKINDSFELAETLAPNVVNFLTWGDVDTSHKGRVIMDANGRKAELHYDASRFEVEVDNKELDDPKLSNVWGNSIKRLRFTDKKQNKKDKYSFLFRAI